MKIPFLTAILFILPTLTLAGSPVSNVGTAKVTEGKANVEARIGFSQDDNNGSNDERLRIREHFDYGFNDWYAMRLVVAQDKRRGDSLQHSGIGIENRFQLIEKRNHGFDAGFRLIYTHADGDKTPHEVDLRVMANVPFGEDEQWMWRTDSAWEHDVGENAESGISLGLRNQVTYKIIPESSSINNLQYGVEMFNSFGRLKNLNGYSNQDHQIGPVMKADFSNGAFVQAGYRTGISKSATDHLVKLFLGARF